MASSSASTASTVPTGGAATASPATGAQGLVARLQDALQAKFGRFTSMSHPSEGAGVLSRSGFQFLLKSCRGVVFPEEVVDLAWSAWSQGAADGRQLLTFAGFVSSISQLASAAHPRESEI
ncbi:hypothetical protein FNF31_06768 [Cafeteria roenbergensis]|uniref:Uncharacterized protein n=1 Tax=Cafeteria roenbergensis TaxID=33653 RepID=A0A5A8CFG2_CAFRO|nr:hypothetical protein FNF31_06768 [Cafeteria roenbergensis]KAA0162395.1 hypothetical protein FNF28_04733 [Cafeteria roenbergensis]